MISTTAANLVAKALEKIENKLPLEEEEIEDLKDARDSGNLGENMVELIDKIIPW